MTDNRTQENHNNEGQAAQGWKKDKSSKTRPHRKTEFTQADLSGQKIEKLERELAKSAHSRNFVAAGIDLYDKAQDRLYTGAMNIWMDLVTYGHKIASSYMQSRRIIGSALLLIVVAAVVILNIFDHFTVYEYAYNGKILGYAADQEDVTDVLDIAGIKMTENSGGQVDIKFTANQNVTFNLVDGRGKTIDDSDAAVNKLVYMTDIETEAYGIYDGGRLTAVVKSNEDAENLLNIAMARLSTPDDGMELVEAEYVNDLEIRPVNVLLTSILSNADALTIMTEGGSTEISHIVEEGETLESIAEQFTEDPVNIFDESNKKNVIEVEQGDKVCIHKITEPVSVKMVEKGRMKEIIEFDTIKKETDELYKGDTAIEQEGVDGVQIFQGTITKLAGGVARRDAESIDVIREKKDKIILVGTAERPKTAPTGTYAMPIKNYVLTSNFGYRWGRLHAGIDMGAPTGTPIYASDGGTVVRSGWYSGYGMCVDVDHGNGRLTRYGHCSALLVSVGQEVYQGQEIALVGNTGHSFGSHLHFEINLNGSPVNPRPYLGI